MSGGTAQQPEPDIDLAITVDDIVLACDADGDGVLTAEEKAHARALGSRVHRLRDNAAASMMHKSVQFAADEWRALIKRVGPGPVSGVDPRVATHA